MDPRSGEVLKEWGSGKTWLPHGLKGANGRLWLVDVGMHQVQGYSLNDLHDTAIPGTLSTSGLLFCHVELCTSVQVS